MESSAAPLPDDNQLAGQLASLQDAPVNRRSNPDEVRASLEAVRAAQETAQARARRETQRARLIVISLLASVGIVVWNVSHRRTQKTPAAIAAPAVATPAAATATSPPEPPARTAPGVTPVVAPALAPAQAPAPAPALAAAAVPAGLEDVAICNAAFGQHQWPAVAIACAAAFRARPTDSAIAMRVAHAELRRGHVADAGEWAGKAIALDPNIPEAHAIQARAETRAGHPRAAATAYRRYLALAPQGWHAAEARRALASSDGR